MIWILDLHNEYQQGMDVRQVAREGYRAIVVKATEGANRYYAPAAFVGWINEARSLGMIAGAYHWMNDDPPAQQVDYFLRRIHGAGGPDGLFCMVDVEDEKRPPSESTVRAWFAEWQQRTGNHPIMLYTGKWWRERNWPGVQLTPYLWLSRYVPGSGYGSELYTKVPASWWTPGFGGWETATLLQFSSRARVAGHLVDVSAFRGTFGELRSLAGAAGSPIHSIYGDDMQSFLRWDKSNAVIYTDGIHGRWIKSERELADIRTLAAEGTLTLGYGGSIRVVGDRNLCGEIIGDLPSEWGPETVY